MNTWREGVREKIKSLSEEWELPLHKLAAITCDNASNNIKCIKENFSVPRVPCVGHVLNLAVSDALKVRGVSEIISRSRSLVEHFHRSRISNEKLEAKAKEDHQQPLKLIQDVATRWNSTYLMMVRLLHLKEYLIKIVEESLSHQNAPSPPYMLNMSEWNVLEQLIPLLQPFYDVTTWISASSYVTVSAAGPSIAMLKMKVRVTNDTPVIKRFKEAAMAKLDKYFHDTEEETLLDVCSYLDPRFRAFQHRVEERSSVQEMVCDKLTDIMTESAGQPSAETYDTIGENRNRLSGGSVGTSSGLARLLGSVMCSDNVDEESRDTQNESVRQRALKEIGRYEVLPVASIDTNPLEWWKIYSTSLPYLSQLAKRYLCIVATSVPSECLFSIAGQIVSARRSRMLPEHTNMLCFLHSNLSCRKPHLPQYQRLWDACGCPKCQALASEKGAGNE